jgi:hypothetical protein
MPRPAAWPILRNRKRLRRLLALRQKRLLVSVLQIRKNVHARRDNVHVWGVPSQMLRMLATERPHAIVMVRNPIALANLEIVYAAIVRRRIRLQLRTGRQLAAVVGRKTTVHAHLVPVLAKAARNKRVQSGDILISLACLQDTFHCIIMN